MFNIFYLMFSCEAILGNNSNRYIAPSYDSLTSKEYIFYVRDNDSVYRPHIVNCFKEGMVDRKLWKKNSYYHSLWKDICIVNYLNEFED